MEFQTEEAQPMQDAIMDDQIAMANLMEARASHVRQGTTVGIHDKDLTMTDPDTGVVRIADINSRDDMELLAAQRAMGSDLNEKRWNPKDPGAAGKNVVYGRGTREPEDPAVLGFTGEISGVWPPNISTTVDFFLANEANLKAEGMQSLMTVFLTDISPLVLSIRGYKQMWSCTSLESYACLFGFMMMLAQGSFVPDDSELDVMFEKMDDPANTPYNYLLFGQRQLQLTLPQLEVYATAMFRHKAEMNSSELEKEKKKEATAKFNQSVEIVTKSVFESLLYYGMGGGVEFSDEQLSQCGVYSFTVLASSDLAGIAAARGQLSPDQPNPDVQTPLVNIRIRSRPTPDWFKKAWKSICVAMVFPNEMNVPSELPVWIDESVLTNVLTRMVLFYYHRKRGIESAKFLSNVIVPFYNMVKTGGADVAVPKVCLELTKESVWTTQRVLMLLEECVLRILAPVYDFDQLGPGAKSVPQYDSLLSKKEGKELVEYFEKGQENIQHSDKWHLHYASVAHCVTEQRICLESSVEICREDPGISQHVAALIDRLSNDELYGTDRWVPSALYVVFSALSANICNQAMVTKDPVAKARVEKFFKSCKTKLYESLPVKKAIEHYIEMKKEEAEAKKAAEASSSSSSKRPAEKELVAPENEEEEEEEENNKMEE